MLNYEIMRFFGSDYETENNDIKKIKDIINSFTVEKLQTILASISDLISFNKSMFFSQVKSKS